VRIEGPPRHRQLHAQHRRSELRVDYLRRDFMQLCGQLRDVGQRLADLHALQLLERQLRCVGFVSNANLQPLGHLRRRSVAKLPVRRARLPRLGRRGLLLFGTSNLRQRLQRLGSVHQEQRCDLRVLSYECF
jgi:hypothetical protein